MIKISFVIPCYRSEHTIQAVVQEITDTMVGLKGYIYEIILVNDASPDHVWLTIKEMAERDKHILGVNLARNFGQHAALMAGYHFVTGDIIISMDDDGQTPANEAPKLIGKIRDGYDVVYARYKRNMENTFRRFGSWVNLKMAEHMIDKPKGLAIQSYFAAKRFVIEEILHYDHAYPYIFGLIFRTTQNVANVEIIHRSREIGSSGYTLSKLLGLWMNGFTAFSIKPLRIATWSGMLCALSGFLLTMWSIINKLVDPSVPLGYSSLIATNVFFGGAIMLLLGLIGEYIGRIYICINRSPQYVVKECTTIYHEDQEHSAQT